MLRRLALLAASATRNRQAMLSSSPSSTSSSRSLFSSSPSRPPRRVLVLNAGSSSLKLKLFEEERETLTPVASALVERLGTDAATLRSWRRRTGGSDEAEAERLQQGPNPVPGKDIRAALSAALPSLGIDEKGSDLFACGHRVVHGGELSASREWPGDDDDGGDKNENSTRVAVASATALAPLHNPRNVEGAEAALELFPRATHVAVFDTAFHVSSLPAEAFSYALPRSMGSLGGRRRPERSSPTASPLPVPIRKYGFHGSSFKHAVRATSELLGLPLPSPSLAAESDDGEGCLDAVAFHLGAGASACAISKGRSVDTSLGATPLQGLVMATRCGDVDPAVPLMVASEWEEEREASPSSSVVERVLASLNKEAGLAALAGPGVAPGGDLRDVIAAAAEDSKGEGSDEAKERRRRRRQAEAQLALSVYIHRIRHYLGAYFLNHKLNGKVHAIIFTGGVGENSPLVRARVLEGLERLGIEVDKELNEAAVGVQRAVRIDSHKNNGIAIVVVPADEEAVIARDAWEVAVRKEKRREKGGR